MVDHINRDKGDNRLKNLRYVERRQNGYNQQRQVDGKTSSRYRGVCWDKDKQRWKAQIGINGKSKQLGRYRTEEEAAAVYDAALLNMGLPAVNFKSDT